MSFGNTIFTIAGLMLLSTVTLSLNSSIVSSQAMLYESEQIVEAIALGQKYIEQAETCRFNEDLSASIPSSFVKASSLGPDSGENYPYFDDIDDFDGFDKTIDTGTSRYQVTINVDYVDKDNPDTPIFNQTYFKRILVKVSSPALSTLPSKSITLKRLFAYHYFYAE